MPYPKRFSTKFFMQALLIAIPAALPGAAGATVTFDWATVGNAGNAADTTGFGAVSYEYRISKHEVTNAQYVKFLNAVDPMGTNSLSLYHPDMASNFGGIENTGVTDGARYVVKSGRANTPVTYVSWYDAARFTNWLHNGQGNGSTESGVYDLSLINTNPSGISRASGASFFLPSEDEWYKAAYHDVQSGLAGDYFLYATSSDDVPVSDNPVDSPGGVNYFNHDNDDANGINDGYALSGLTYPSSTSPFTDVGAYSEAASPYGTFDQNGNVLEWNETLITSYQRGLRGGMWIGSENGLRSTLQMETNPFDQNDAIGFRVASPVPEPGTFAVLGVAGLFLAGRRHTR